MTPFARVVAGLGGLPRVQIASPQARGELYLHGAQIVSWRPSGCEDDVLFVSERARWEPGRAVRGGIPVCFPWFGTHPSDPEAPSHGLARLHAWRLDGVTEDDGVVTVRLSMSRPERSQDWWPRDVELTLCAAFGRNLAVELSATNAGSQTVSVEAALHTYYRVSHIDEVTLRGLDGVTYIDTVGVRARRQQDGDLTIAGEVDRIYLQAGPIEIVDASRRISVDGGNAPTTVIWNPWVARAAALADLGDLEYQHFVCVETSSVAPHPIELSPGQCHAMRMVVSVGSRDPQI